MAWIAEDNFDSYSDGNLTGNSGGSNWTTNWSTIGSGSWEPQVEGSVVLQGTKSISMTPDNGSDRGAIRTFTAITSGTFYIMVRRNTSSTGQMYFGLRGDAGYGPIIYMNSSGNIVANATTLQAYSADTTYTLAINFDCATDLFSVSVNGGTFSSDIAFDTAATNLHTIRVMSADATTGVTNYFDFISPTALVTSSINSISGQAYSLDSSINGITKASISSIMGVA